VTRYPLLTRYPLRVGAVIVALRRGSLTTAQLRNAIGDDTKEQTDKLLGDMAAAGAVAWRSGRWYLDHDGLAILQRDGLDAIPEARIWHGQDGAA
jgi:hypothetical protein